MHLSQRFYVRDEELGKKDDDHRPGQRVRHRFRQRNPKMHLYQRRGIKRFAFCGVCLVTLYCLYKYVQSSNHQFRPGNAHKIGLDTDHSPGNRPKNDAKPQNKPISIVEPINKPTEIHETTKKPISIAEPKPFVPDKPLVPEKPSLPEKPLVHELDSSIKLTHLSSTRVPLLHTQDGDFAEKIVLFAAANLQSAAMLIPLACEMANWQRNYVNFAIMGRDNIPIHVLKSLNGVGEKCRVVFHDARPNFSSSSSDDRMMSSVSIALDEINEFLNPKVILIDASETEDLWFVKWFRSKAFELGRTVVELPKNAEKKLRWISLLDSKSLSAWNHVSLEIIIHPQPSATGSLVRLLESLKKADYSSSILPHITIELPHNVEEQTTDYLREFKWPPAKYPNQGNLLTLHHRIPQHTLTPNENLIRTLESFWPSDPFHSQVLILSPQAEVSPLFFHYLKYLILEYKYGSKSSENEDSLLGISLDLPSSFLNDTAQFTPPKVNSREFMPFLWQAPNSNAGLLFADKWIELHDFVSRSLHSRNSPIQSKVLASRKKDVSKTFPNWLEYILQLARARGYMTLYPNFGNRYALVTVHDDLYKVPEEYKRDFESRDDSSGGSPSNLEDYLSSKHKENPLVVDSLWASLSTQSQLPGLKELSMLSWDGNEIDNLKVKSLAVEYKKSFRIEFGGCTKEEINTAEVFSTADLFCVEG